MRALIIVSLLGACGKGKDNAGPPPASSGSGSSAAPTVKPAAKPAEPAPVVPAIKLPGDVSADKPLSVVEADAIAKAWPADKELTFIGYPAFFIGDSGQLNMGLKLAAEAAQKDSKALAYCTSMAPSEKDKKVDNATPLTIKGRFTGRWDKQLVAFKDCVITASGTAAKPDAVLGGPQPVGVDKLAAGYLGWFGKEISVTGYLGNQTISRKLPKDGGAIIDVRLDLMVEAGKFARKVGCHLPLVEPEGALKESLEKNKAKLTVKGTIKDFVFGELQLDPCTAITN